MKTVKIILILITALVGVISLLDPPIQKAQQKNSQTRDPLANWRPFNEAHDIKYVGTQTCLECHTKDHQLETPMAHASLRPADSEVLKKNPVLKFKNGEYSYEL